MLAAWHTATLRLERTHETLFGEVARLNNELEIKNRELARKNRLADLGQMASHVAHEVRNNLVPVSLYMSLLRRRLSEDSGSLDILAKIEAGFTALEATVSDLLSFTAHRQPQWQTFLVGDLVNEVCESLEPQLEAQMIDVDIDVPPNTLLSADREMIRRAVLNLVLNAIDAMPDGGDAGDHIVRQRPRLRAGSRRQRSRTQRRSQTPRVRAVLQHQAKRHRPRPGDCVPRCRSTRRHGHRDELPRRRRCIHDQDSSPHDASRCMSRKAKNDERFRVLVVDDHASAREAVADVLRHAGYDVAACASAIEALAKLAQRPVDVVVTDLQMPGMNGLEFIREIERRRLGVQVLMITAHASVSSAVEAMRHGAFDYIEKPFDAMKLEQSVSRACDRRRLMQQDSSTAAAGAERTIGMATADDRSAGPIMIGSSQVMHELRDASPKLPPPTKLC